MEHCFLNPRVNYPLENEENHDEDEENKGDRHCQPEKPINHLHCLPSCIPLLGQFPYRGGYGV